tara:strand:- start:334 stop:1263 length:930 start_codon:yes stop_codon:yes gene_type:complete
MIPIIKTIQYYFPKTDITWIIGKTEYLLVKNMKRINFVIIDKKKNIRSILDMQKKIGNETFDIFLHMQKSLRSKIVGFLVKYKKKLDYSNVNIPNNYHVLDSFFCFLRDIGINDKILDWSINIDPLKKNQFNFDKKYIVLNPFTSIRRFNYREWKIENYISVAKYTYEKYGLESIIVGGSSTYEIHQSKKIDSQSFVHNIVGKTSLHQIYNIIRNSKFYIGPDSGTMHIASMLKIPIIGLFATSNPDRTGPYNNQDYIINKYDRALEVFLNKNKKQVKWGKRIRNKKAMSLITTNDVLEKIDEIMKKKN